MRWTERRLRALVETKQCVPYGTLEEDGLAIHVQQDGPRYTVTLLAWGWEVGRGGGTTARDALAVARRQARRMESAIQRGMGYHDAWAYAQGT